MDDDIPHRPGRQDDDGDGDGDDDGGDGPSGYGAQFERN